MVALRTQQRRSPRRSAGVLALSSAGLLALAALRTPAFLASPPPVAGTAEAGSGRRGALLAAITGATAGAATMGMEQVFAAGGGAEILEASGAPDSWNYLNGKWSILPGKSVNERGVYKRDGQDYFLVENNCGKFQIAKDIEGTCDGLAIENRGNWRFDGMSVRGFKLKPVKTESAKPIKVEKTKSERDMELLMGNEGINVGAYVKANGGQDFLNNQMRMEDDEAKIADSLESRLGKIQFSSKGTTKLEYR